MSDSKIGSKAAPVRFEGVSKLFGKDVVAPLENVIGGQDYIGLGWKMLMEQLAGGRAVSLPAGAVGGMRSVASVTGPYSMIRQQFGIPIGYMEGIQDKVGKIAGLTYLAEAARVFGCSICSGRNSQFQKARALFVLRPNTCTLIPRSSACSTKARTSSSDILRRLNWIESDARVSGPSGSGTSIQGDVFSCVAT